MHESRKGEKMSQIEGNMHGLVSDIMTKRNQKKMKELQVKVQRLKHLAFTKHKRAYRGCRLVAGAIDLKQSGIPKASVLTRENMAIIGPDFSARTCALRGVVKFNIISGAAAAFLDPNYRDPNTGA